MLEGRVAIVTGASSGLGRAIALALIAEGAKVLGVARSLDLLEDLAKQANGSLTARVCDMRKREDVEALPAAAVEAFGQLDILVNNAGIAPAGQFAEEPFEVFEEVFAVNVFGPALLCRAAAPLLLGQGHGKVLNIASTSGILGKASLVAYSASKGAVLQFTKALAAEWAKANIQVNAIAPGAFETRAQQAVLDTPDILIRRLRKIPAGRMGQTWEIGPLACLLVAPASDFITGSVFVIDGGEASAL
jgi:2-deoxy-D-gluconate 3-dehydrogenase